MFEIRKIKKDKWLIILLVGLLLVVIAMPVSDIKSDQTQDEQQVQKAENASEDTYTDALETRLENALAKVEGVGNVKVMITLASSSEKVVEKDQEMTSEEQANTLHVLPHWTWPGREVLQRRQFMQTEMEKKRHM